MKRSAVFVLFIVICIAPAYSYIDPATGSMLFTALLGIGVTVYFFVRNLVIRVKSVPLFSRSRTAGKSGGRPVFALYSEGKQYWNVFKPVVEEMAVRGHSCAYFTSGEDDPGLEFCSPSIATRFIGKGVSAHAVMNFLEADVCLMTTPGLDVFQLKRSPGVNHYSHILHAVNDATLYRLFGLDYFDSVLLSGAYQESSIRELEKKRGTAVKDLPVVGCTYLDVLKEKAEAGGRKRGAADARKVVLVSPSWGDNGILKKFGARLLEPLVRSTHRIIVRPHPQSLISEKETVEALRERFSSFPNLEWDFGRENLEAMARSDVMISDFSGIIFDYAILFDRPVVYTKYEFDARPYDASDVDESPWTFRVLPEIGTELTESDFGDIGRVLEAALTDRGRAAAVESVRKTAYPYPGQAGLRTVDALEKILAGLN